MASLMTVSYNYNAINQSSPIYRILSLEKLTLQDMVNSTKKCTTNWGIDGYSVHSNGGPLNNSPKYSFQK